MQAGLAEQVTACPVPACPVPACPVPACWRHSSKGLSAPVPWHRILKAPAQTLGLEPKTGGPAEAGSLHVLCLKGQRILHLPHPRQEWAPAAACRPLAQPFFSLPAYPFRLWPDKLLPYGSLPVPGICRMGHALRQPAGSRSFPPYFLQPCAGSLTGSKRTSFILPLSSQI